MSKIKSYIYYIEYKDGSDETMNQFMLQSVIDNIFDNFFKIVKKYWLHDQEKRFIISQYILMNIIFWLNTIYSTILFYLRINMVPI